MTFRDDHDAALARADALAQQVERLEKERAELAAERDELTSERDEIARERDKLAAERAEPEPAFEPQPRAEGGGDSGGKRSKVTLIAVIGGSVLLAGVIVAGIAVDCNRDRRHDRWKAAMHARQRYKARWQAVISTEPCVRDAAYDAVLAQEVAPDRVHPKTKPFAGNLLGRLESNCTGSARRLVNDAATPAEVRAGLKRWLAVEAQLAPVVKSLSAYYSNRDWVEDDVRRGKALWAKARPLIDQRRAIFADLRKTALPALRAEMRQKQRAHEATSGRDEVWWRIQLGLALWQINDRSFDVIGIYAGRRPDPATAPPVLREPVARLVANGRQAPLPVRRSLRKIDWITGPLSRGQLPRGETPLWHLDRADLLSPTRDTPPAMPLDPGPEPHTHW